MTTKIPLWLKTESSPDKEKKKAHRMFLILRVLSLEGPLTIYGLDKKLIKKESANISYTSMLRYIRLLKELKLIVVKEESGPRKESICDITNYGISAAFFEHYLSSSDFLETIKKRSKLISIFTKYSTLKNYIEKRWVAMTANLNIWSLATTPNNLIFKYESGGEPGSIEDIEDKKFETAKNDFYEGLITSLEFAIISDMPDNITAKDLAEFDSSEIKYLSDELTKASNSWNELLKNTQQHINNIQRFKREIKKRYSTSSS